ncbi:MAG: NAD(P)H-dependent oxidoreductase subunit E [Candidatus Bathyarchaeota archaeon]
MAQTVLKADKRSLILEAYIKQQQHRKDSLIEILHTAQELYGYLDSDLLLYISKVLNLPSSRVYGVATFYNFFKLRKPGTHVITVCMGTACYVKGSEEILSAIEREFNIKRGETDVNARFSLFITRCIGSCAMAPNVIIDGEVIGKAMKADVLNKVKSLIGENTIEAR